MHPILKDIWDRYVAGDVTNISDDIIALLLKHGHKIRQDDGDIIQINLSIPTTNINALVIGLRYIKRNKTNSEDAFICLADEKTGDLIIAPYYRGKIEHIYPEYKGTHKHQIGDSLGNEKYITQVNTITHWLKKK